MPFASASPPLFNNIDDEQSRAERPAYAARDSAADRGVDGTRYVTSQPIERAARSANARRIPTAADSCAARRRIRIRTQTRRDRARLLCTECLRRRDELSPQTDRRRRAKQKGITLHAALREAILAWLRNAA